MKDQSPLKVTVQSLFFAILFSFSFFNLNGQSLLLNEETIVQKKQSVSHFCGTPPMTAEQRRYTLLM